MLERSIRHAWKACWSSSEHPSSSNHHSLTVNVALFLPFTDHNRQQRGANTDTVGTRDYTGIYRAECPVWRVDAARRKVRL